MGEKRPTSRCVPDYYDQVADTWDESHGAARQNVRFAGQLRENLRLLFSNCSSGSTALELGAGTGPYVEVVAPLVKYLVASDLSEGMLRVFSRRVASLGLTNVALARVDACDLGAIAANSVDIVYSIGLLETIADFDRLFFAAHRVVKPGGLVAGITSNGDCPWYAVRKWLEGGERHGRTGHLATAMNLADVCRRTGFGPPEVHYWGALPPGLKNGRVVSILSAVEPGIAATPLARYLGVLSFRALKHSRQVS